MARRRATHDGSRFLRVDCGIQREYVRGSGKDIVISNCIQTNGVLLDDEWIDFFVANDFNVSISLDGFFDLHARNRGTNREAFDAIMRSAARLSERKVPFSVLTVVTNETLGQEEELFDFFADYDISSFGFLPMNYGDEQDSLSPDDYGAFLRKFFELGHTMPSECDGCKFGHICNGGCRYHRWLNADDFSKRQFYCSSYKALYSDIAACLAMGAEQQ